MMKRTIKLLILLLAIVVGLSSYVNFTLAKEYSKIDVTDKFYEYQKDFDLAMTAISIEGGNKTEIKIEKGETNGIYLHKRIASQVKYTSDNNVLSITFNDDYTDTIESPEKIRRYNNSPRVIITYKDVNQINVNNTRFSFDYASENEVNFDCKGSSMLLMSINGQESGTLKLNASGRSLINIAQTESASSLDYASITLKDEAQLKINEFRADSVDLNMEDRSRIDCDNRLLTQLSNSRITK